MRNKRLIDSLFPKTRGDILAATYGQHERWWYLTELARHLQTTPSSLQRELQSLVSSGILRQRRDGKRIYFQAEDKSPIFEELRSILTKTLGVADALAATLAEFDDRIACAFLYGAAASQGQQALGDLDLIVIGSVGLSDISSPLCALETKFKREFDVTCYSPEELRKKIEAHNEFLISALAEEKLFLKGDKNELESLAREPEQTGA